MSFFCFRFQVVFCSFCICYVIVICYIFGIGLFKGLAYRLGSMP